MFIDLPPEIFKKILSLLSRKDIYRLLCVSRAVYQASLAHLYFHLHMKDYVYTRQLQYAIKKNTFLYEITHRHTKRLTLYSKQHSNSWRINDLLQIFGSNSNITHLTFNNYHELTTKMISEVIAILPHVTHVEFKYCHIVYSPLTYNTKKPSLLYPKQATTVNQANNRHFKSLSFTWTDFTQKAIIPSLYSQITHLELGPNRNKYIMVNELMAKSITTYCPHVTHLSIILPQVFETTLCDIVAYYGAQLQELSIRCESDKLLHTIVLHSRNLRHLAIRVSPSAENDKISDHLTNVIQKCSNLTELQVSSCFLEGDIPLEVWESIAIHCKEAPTMYTNDIIKKAEMISIRKSANHPIKSTTTHFEDAFPLLNHIWFDAENFEDVLQQRYLYNLLNGNKQCNSTQEKLVICHSVLQKSLKRINECSTQQLRL